MVYWLTKEKPVDDGSDSNNGDGGERWRWRDAGEAARLLAAGFGGDAGGNGGAVRRGGGGGAR